MIAPASAWTAAGLAVGLAVVLALAAGGPTAVQVGAVALVQLSVVSRWFTAVEAPGGRVGALVGVAAALGADLAVVLREDRRPLAPVTAVLGLAMLASLLHQLARRDGRDRLTASLAATVALAVLGGLGTCYLGAQAERDGAPFTVAAVLAAALVVVAAAVPVPLPARTGLGAVAGLAVAAATGGLSDLGVRDGLLVGLAAVAVAAVSVVVARQAARPEPMVMGGLPLLLVAPVAFVLARLLGA